MNRLIVAVLTAMCIAGCQQPENRAAKVQAIIASVEVKTAKCESCVKAIENALKNIDGVKKVEVDLTKKVATVQFVQAKVTLDALETAIAKAGYDANAKKRDETAYAALPACCQ